MPPSPASLPTLGALQRFRGRAPGLLLTAGLAAAAIALSSVPWLQAHGISALTLAIVLGIAVGNTVYPHLAASSADGVGVAKHWLLRAGIVQEAGLASDHLPIVADIAPATAAPADAAAPGYSAATAATTSST